jgi:hypothetical protein
MHSVIQPAQTAASQSQKRPILDSYDSGEEFSFLHWVEVRKLVDAEEISSSNHPQSLRKGPRAATDRGKITKQA